MRAAEVGGRRLREWCAGYVAHPRHGPLPALLLMLTVSTGMVDAVSILSLGRVCVANMRGNIVFIGFALAAAPGFSLQASVVALAGFSVGTGVGGVVVNHRRQHRGALLRNAVALEFVLLGCAAIVLGCDSMPYRTAWQDVAVALAALALGAQNAAVRNVAVPDLTTTVLTMTMTMTMTVTGVAADLRARDCRRGPAVASRGGHADRSDRRRASRDPFRSRQRDVGGQCARRPRRPRRHVGQPTASGVAVTLSDRRAERP